METKICSKCKIEKPLTGFYPGKLYADGYHNVCRICTRLYPSQRPKEMLNRTYRIRQRNKQFAFDYLSKHPCVDCGEPDPVVLHFHHRELGTKTKELTKMIHHTHSIKRIQEEIDKCDILCANCHTRRTAKQLNWVKLTLTESDSD